MVPEPGLPSPTDVDGEHLARDDRDGALHVPTTGTDQRLVRGDVTALRTPCLDGDPRDASGHDVGLRRTGEAELLDLCATTDRDRLGRGVDRE